MKRFGGMKRKSQNFPSRWQNATFAASKRGPKPAVPTQARRVLYRRRSKRFYFRVPRNTQALILNFPAVTDFLTWRHRVFIVEVARRMIDSRLHSLRTAATFLGVTASSLCQWLKAFAIDGADGLRPHRRGRVSTWQHSLCSLDIVAGFSRPVANSQPLAGESACFFLPQAHSGVGAPVAQPPVAAETRAVRRNALSFPYRANKIVSTPTRSAAKRFPARLLT
jgi:hypothetical protein